MASTRTSSRAPRASRSSRAIPDFGEHAERGVLLTGARPGSPAEKAGLRAGDLLVKLGGATVASLEDPALALRAHRPRDVVELERKRGAETLRASATLGERGRE